MRQTSPSKNVFPTDRVIHCNYIAVDRRGMMVRAGTITGFWEHYPDSPTPTVCVMLYDGLSQIFRLCEDGGLWRREGNNIIVSIHVTGMEYTIFDVKESP